MNRTLRFTLLALALAAFAGCGDSDPKPETAAPTAVTSGGATGATSATAPTGATSGPAPTKPSAASKRFAAKLDAACRKYDTSEAEIYYADAVASGQDPSSDLDELVTNYRALIKVAEKLDPPAASAQNFDAYVASLQALLKEPGPTSAALNARNEAAIKLGAENCIMDSAD
jgi:hypothetical protein